MWSDEFNGQGLPDNAYWSYEKGLVRNNELQYYTQARPENINMSNGLLTITARKEPYENANYTAASIHTRGKVSWTYGRFEMRARIDTRAGLWPAFWLLGNGKWPEGGEIDVMEYYQNKILANVAWKSPSSDQWNASWDSSTRSLSNLRLQFPDWENRFHTWRMDWDNKSIRLYVDDILMNNTNLSGTKNPDGSNPFIDKPFYILLNLAIGGNNGGDPAGTSFPAKYEIDYVRVYQ
ncbi:MAG TPA: glycoside hydrolase family 16 protein [Cellvibrionaceae bacterium]|nr:glycoside hydrolase family 16 protein [Cellvibrionaceae bacterium]